MIKTFVDPDAYLRLSGRPCSDALRYAERRLLASTNAIAKSDFANTIQWRLLSRNARSIRTIVSTDRMHDFSDVLCPPGSLMASFSNRARETLEGTATAIDLLESGYGIFSPDAINAVHAAATGFSAGSGVLRKGQNWLWRTADISLPMEKFAEPPPADAVTELLAVIEYLARPSLTSLIAMLTLLMEIHPFDDGNGRVFRIMAGVWAAALGLAEIPVSVLSETYLRFESYFGASLERLRRSGDFEPLEQTFAEIVVASCSQMDTLRELTENAMRDIQLRQRCLPLEVSYSDVLESVLVHEAATPDAVSIGFNLDHSTARTLLASLEKDGFISRVNIFHSPELDAATEV